MPNQFAEVDRRTDARLRQLERQIRIIMDNAANDMGRTIDTYFAAMEGRIKHERELLNDGKITQQQYDSWLLNQIGRGQRYIAMQDSLANRAADAGELARSRIADAIPAMYADNRNYAAYIISNAGERADFTLLDEATVLRLVQDQPDLMPYYPMQRAFNRGIDVDYGKRQITRRLTSGILQGKPIRQIARDLQNGITGMEYTSAIRAARTAATAAQNGGRMATFRQAEEMGIKLHKEWMATLDGRTRHSHQELDGESIPIKDTFWNGCAYPGDPDGPDEEVYNCRCTMVADLEGVKTQPRVTYREWAEQQKKDDPKKVDRNAPNPAPAPAPAPKVITVPPDVQRAVTMGRVHLLTDPETGEAYYQDMDTGEVVDHQVVQKAQQQSPTIGGVHQGDTMSVAEADEHKTNPHYGQDWMYSVNCQTCTPVYEARRRGYNVIATGNNKKSDSPNKELSYNTTLAYIDPATGQHPKLLYDPTATTAKRCYTYLERTVQQGQRWSIEFQWSGRSASGHIINMDRDEDGNLRFIDNQRGRFEQDKFTGEAEIMRYLKQLKYQTSFYGMKYYVGPKILRLDNLEFDLDMMNKICEKG